MAQTDSGKELRDKIKAERLAYQQRVLDEQDALKMKVDSLHAFIQSGGYYNVHDDEKGMLQAQLNCMQEYLRILNQRIALHKAM